MKHFWPLLFIFFLWAFFSSPYFLRHKIPYPSDYQVNNFTPWSAYPQLLGVVKNGAMPDVVDEIYPWKHFTVDELKKGRLPMWNPYSFSGNPHLANYQSSVFSPLNLLYFILPFINAWSISVLLQPLIAGLTTYLFLRTLRVGKSASVVGSVTFMFCGFMTVWMAYATLGYAIAFLPLALFAVESFFEKKRIFFLAVLFLTIPFSLFSGHFQTSIYFLLCILFYLLFKIWTTKNYKSTLPVLCCIFLGIGSAAVQLLPSIELYKESVRSGIFRDTGGIPFHYLITLFAPDYFGNPVTRNDWFGYYAEWASFVGIVPLFLSIVAMTKRSNKYIVFFTVTFFVTFLLSLATPIDKLFQFLRIPVLGTSSPSRIIVLSSFSLSVLAGFGFDRLREILEKKTYKKLIVPGGVSFGFLVLGIFAPFLLHMSREEKIIAYHNMVIPIVLFLIFLLIITFNLFQNHKTFPIKIRKPFGLPLRREARAKNKRFAHDKVIEVSLLILLVLSIYDSFHFAQKWMPFSSAGNVFPTLPVITAMQKEEGSGRVLGNFGAYIDTYYGIRSLEGYDPLYEKRYGEFITSAASGIAADAQRSIVKLNRKGKYTDRVLDLLDAEFIYHPILDTGKSWAYPVWQDKTRFKKVYQDEHFQLFKNATAIKRPELFYNAEILSDKNAILKRFYSDSFDFRKTLILEEPIPARLEKGSGTVSMLLDKPELISVSVATNKPALLFLSDTYYPGWKALVDGKESKIYRADYAFRAVFIPSGDHKVFFTYSPKSFQLGIAVSSGSAIAGLLLILLYLFPKTKL